MNDRERRAADMTDTAYRVTEPWRIGRCKMKVGDVLDAYNYDYGSFDYVILFHSRRLQRRFGTGMAAFAKRTTPLAGGDA